MFAIGDIASIYCPIAGYPKYHLCICVGTNGAASQFIFLNSDPDFDGLFVCPCERVPCVPKSETGVTAFSFTAIPRYNDKQLALYKAKKLGVIDGVLATEINKFVSDRNNLKALNSTEVRVVQAAFKIMCA